MAARSSKQGKLSFFPSARPAAKLFHVFLQQLLKAWPRADGGKGGMPIHFAPILEAAGGGLPEGLDGQIGDPVSFRLLLLRELLLSVPHPVGAPAQFTCDQV